MKRLMFTICLFLCLCLASNSFGVGLNIAPTGTVTSSTWGVGWISDGGTLQSAADGLDSTGVHTLNTDPNGEFIEVELPAEVNLLSVEAFSDNPNHWAGATMIVLDAARNVLYTSEAATGTLLSSDNGGAGFEGVKYIRCIEATSGYLVVMEIRAFFDAPPPVSVDAGPNVTIELGQTASLNSTVYDAKGPVVLQWSEAGVPGGENVALTPDHNSVVTAYPESANWPSSEPNMVVDGKNNTGYHTGSPDSWIKVELDDVYNLSSVSVYSDSSWIEGCVVSVLDSSEVQIGASYTVPVGTTGSVLSTSNGGAGFADAKYLLVSHISYVALREIKAWSYHDPVPVVTYDPNANYGDPTVSFNVAGVYALQVDVNDGVDEASDAVTVTVTEPVFALSAGPDDVQKGLVTPYQLNSTVWNAEEPVVYDWSVINWPGGENVAIGAMVDGSSLMGGYPWTNAVDDNVNTIAHTLNDSGGEYIEIDMWSGYDLEKIVLYGSDSHSPDSNVIVFDSGYNVIWESGLLEYVPGSVYIFDNNGAGFTDAEYIRVEHDLPTYYVAIAEIEAWTYHDPIPVVTFDPNANVADPLVSFNTLGAYTFQLDANDANNAVEELSDTVIITVESVVDMNAGDDFGVVNPATIISLNGSITALSAPITYDWSYLGYMPSESVNVALDGTATMSSQMPGYDDGPERAIDDIFTGWIHTNGGAAEWWEVDLGATYNLAKVVFFNDNNPGTHCDGAVISVLDGSRVEIWNSGPITCQMSLPYLEKFIFNNGGAGMTGARYVRMDNDYYIKFVEMQAWTAPVPADPTASFSSSTVQDPTVTVGDTGLYTFQLDVTGTDTVEGIPYEDFDSVNVKVLPAGWTTFGRIVDVVASSSGGGHGAPMTVGQANAAIADDGLYIATGAQPAANWISGDGTTVADQYLELELAGKYDLNYIRLWNYNADGYFNKYFGVKDAIVLAKENAGDAYVQIGTIAAGVYVEDNYDKDQSSVFAVDTSSFANGVGFVKIDIQSNLREQAVDTVGLSYIAFSAACANGNIAGDINNDCEVDMADFAELASQWLNTNCAMCGGANLEGDDGDVDYADLKVITDNYLQ